MAEDARFELLARGLEPATALESLAFHGERLRIFEQPPCARFPVERLDRKPLVLLLLEVLPRLGQARKRLERLNEPAVSLAHVEADEGQVPAAWPFFQQRTAKRHHCFEIALSRQQLELAQLLSRVAAAHGGECRCS
jgi:hypothetical protein